MRAHVWKCFNQWGTAPNGASVQEAGLEYTFSLHAADCGVGTAPAIRYWNESCAAWLPERVKSFRDEGGKSWWMCFTLRRPPLIHLLTAAGWEVSGGWWRRGRRRRWWRVWNNQNVASRFRVQSWLTTNGKGSKEWNSFSCFSFFRVDADPGSGDSDGRRQTFRGSQQQGPCGGTWNPQRNIRSVGWALMHFSGLWSCCVAFDVSAVVFDVLSSEVGTNFVFLLLFSPGRPLAGLLAWLA